MRVCVCELQMNLTKQKNSYETDEIFHLKFFVSKNGFYLGAYVEEREIGRERRGYCMIR